MPSSPPTFRSPVLVLGALCLAGWAILRAVLAIRFGLPAGVGVATAVAALAAGLGSDAVTAVYLLLPVTLYLALAPPRLLAAGAHRRLVLAATWVAAFAGLYVAAAEYFFFEEFQSRFNLVSVDYLLYPTEVLTNVWESYPVVPVLVASGALALGLAAAVGPTLAGGVAAPRSRRRRATAIALHGTLVAILAVTLSSRSFAVFDDRIAGELAVNGVASFCEALRTNELDYYAHYRTGDPQAMFRLLADHLARGGELTRLTEGRLDRRFGTGAGPGRQMTARRRRSPEEAGPGIALAAGAGTAHPVFASLPEAEPSWSSALPRTRRDRLPNLVVVLEESLGAEFVGAAGDDRGLTPELDALAERGLYFTRAYATGTRTVRGLEAVVASFPPIPSVSIVRRPGCEGIATWGGVLARRGYRTAFLYGGYAVFDNMRHFFGANGYEVSDRGDVDEPAFANAWGISDEDLFRHAVTTFDGYATDDATNERPFFAVVLTTSNHKPFTFPPGIPGVPERGGGRLAGVRYADHALGTLFRLAETRPWFDDTVFVVVADHGARIYGAAEIPLASYEIPLVILAPGRIAPARLDVPISQIDLAPTVLGLLGIDYEAPFFGQDVLAAGARGPSELLFNHNHDVALLRGDELAVLGLRRRAETYRYDPATKRLDRGPADPELVDLATAYYQTAYDQFHHGTYR